MKKNIIFVHDRLYYIAGAEQVFFQYIHEILQSINYDPDKHKLFICTMFSDKKYLSLGTLDNEIKIPITTALPRWVFAVFTFFDRHKTPFISKLLDYRNLMFFYPILIRLLQMHMHALKADEIYISSFAVAKNVAELLSYDHSRSASRKYFLHAQSPFMYIHNHYQNNLKKLRFPIKQLYQLAHFFLSPWDLKTRSYAYVTANSNYTAGLIKQIYDVHVDKISYPKLDPLFSKFPVISKRSDYYVFIGRLVTFSKQLDIIVETFNKSGYTLVIIGAGPDEQYLKSIAKSNIEFLGRIADPQKRCEIIGKAKGLINITMESFGYVTAESLCIGTPVIGYNKGATPEIVDDTSGILIPRQDKSDLLKAINEFESRQYNYTLIAESARKRFQFSDLEWRIT